jgi:hypothetical protein
MPELVAMCCTLLVLAPLALMRGAGKFLFLPMAYFRASHSGIEFS